MKAQVGTGQLTEWFNKASDEELAFLSEVSPGAINRLCMLLTLEDQILYERETKSRRTNKQKRSENN
jgi:hypothetical protein